METKISELITNNQKQRLVNSRFLKSIDVLQGQTLENHIIEQARDQLLLLVKKFNAVKNNEYLTQSLNSDDIKEIIDHELISVPIINILEYTGITLVMYTGKAKIDNNKNIHDRLMEAIHIKHDEDFEIIKVLNSS